MSENLGIVRDALRQERHAVRAALAAGLLVTLCTVGLAGTSAWLIVRAAQRPSVLSLTVPMGLVQLFALAKAAGRYLERTQTHRAALSAMGRVRASVAQLLEPLLPAGLGPRSSEVVDSVLGDVERVQDLLTAVAGPLATSVCAGLLSVVVLGLIAPLTGLVLIVAIALDAFALPWLALRLGATSSLEIDAVHAQMTELFDHAAQSGDEFIMVGASRQLRQRLSNLEDRGDVAQLRRRAAMGLVGAATVLVNGIAAITVAEASISGLRSGHLAPALLAVPALTTVAVAELVSGFVGGVVSASRDRAAIGRLEALSHRSRPVREPDVSLEPGDDDQSVSMEDVTHSYDETTVFRDVSLVLRPGDVVVLEGPSGGGKTTLARLVAKFLDPTQGHIRLGDVDYALLSSDTVRSRVGLVDDAPHVFSTSLAHNLRIAAPDASDEQLLRALCDAGLGGFFRGLEQGLDTPLGGESTGLSGGEQRRLGVARELLTDRRIAVFDEPTEGLDDEAAHHLLVALREHYRVGVLVIISHQDAERLPGARLWRLADGRLEMDDVRTPSSTRSDQSADAGVDLISAP
jgi:thiol reductant ABC exporter CydC subunit